MSKPAEPHLSVRLKHRLGALELDVAFELTKPWTVLFGPSGSGKSTILRAIAGLICPDEAKIGLRQGDTVQIAADTKNSISLPAHRRFARWTAQRAALFPNMTVRQNLRFALHESGRKADHIADAALARFRLAAFAERKPSALSGGEQQRVSLARAAISSKGFLLLLDEPFAGLDAALRDDLLAGLRSWLAEHRTPVLSVTHDIGEAFLLSSEVIRLHQGRIVAQGPVGEVLAEERSRILAQLGTL